MPGPAPTQKIELNPEQWHQVKQIAHSPTAPHAQVVRAKIIELAIVGMQPGHFAILYQVQNRSKTRFKLARGNQEML